MTNREAYKEAFRGVQRGDLCGFIQRTVFGAYGPNCPDVGCDACSKIFDIWLDKEYDCLDKEYEAAEQEVERAKMIVIKTELKELPEYCEQCKYYYLRVRGKSGYSDICEISGERMDYGECKDGWYYNGLTRPDNCPLMEVEDDK